MEQRPQDADALDGSASTADRRLPTADSFRLPSHMRAAIVAHARREAPRECCGVVSGENGVPVETIPLTNVYAGDDFFEIDADELYRVYRDLDAAGQEIIVNYHSHPVSPAYPSARDVAHAQWGEIVYLICSLEDPDAPVLRAFQILDGEIAEIRIEVAEPTAEGDTDGW